ncbi:DUF3817 domain-containing protein [Gordonia sp. X0973]|uniref:DUF3817 domain-containing protein n=1 Tax=Gordonia sp. X0973 TaxID=2742602 RepID=UPI000F52CC15|nr:DUF3817 domain-containing protein [Gordonia sp. X0973]QKT06876.1 DUF3817 domain-containing protein [Gordonia sp. X0973]
MTDTQPTTPDTATQAANAAKIPGALARYRALAWFTGIWLLVLVAEIIAKYGFGVQHLNWIGIVHGWVYFVYLIFCLDLAFKARWSIGKTIATALAGTIPFLSFYVEHIRTKDVKAQFGL